MEDNGCGQNAIIGLCLGGITAHGVLEDLVDDGQQTQFKKMYQLQNCSRLDGMRY